MTKEAHTAETTAVDPVEIEEFDGTAPVDLHGIDVDLHDRSRPPHGPVRGRHAAPTSRLAEKAELKERYVREWLGALVTARIFEYDPATARTLCRRARRALDRWADDLARWPHRTHLGKHVHQVARAFHEGGGVPYAEFRPEFTDVMDGISRGSYDAFLVDAYLPSSPALVARLSRASASPTSRAAQVTARPAGPGVPGSTFVGYDLDDGAIARARAEAAGAELDNVRSRRDAAPLASTSVRAVFVFDAIHDQVDPAAVLEHIHAPLDAGSVFFMKEPHAPTRSRTTSATRWRRCCTR